MSDNIVKFPRTPKQTVDNQAGLPTTMEDAYVQIREIRSQYIEESMEDITAMMSTAFMQFGFKLDTGDRDCQKAWYFMCEAIEAALYRAADVPHHLHGVIDDVVRFEDEKPVKKARKSRKKVTGEDDNTRQS